MKEGSVDNNYNGVCEASQLILHHFQVQSADC